MNNLNLYIKKITLVILILVIFSFVLIEGILIFHGNKTEDDVDIDYLLVLGARLYGEVPSPALEERLNKSIEYLELNPETTVIVCGSQGHDEDITEALAMKRFLVDKGIDKDKIIKEEQSTSTFENIKNARSIIREIDDSENINVLIVTSDFHIFRSKLLAKRLGLNAYGLPAKTPKIVIFKSYIREYLAVIKSLIVDWE